MFTTVISTKLSVEARFSSSGYFAAWTWCVCAADAKLPINFRCSRGWCTERRTDPNHCSSHFTKWSICSCCVHILSLFLQLENAAFYLKIDHRHSFFLKSNSIFRTAERRVSIQIPVDTIELLLLTYLLLQHMSTRYITSIFHWKKTCPKKHNKIYNFSCYPKPVRYSGWPLFTLLRALRPHLWRLQRRPKTANAVAATAWTKAEDLALRLKKAKAWGGDLTWPKWLAVFETGGWHFCMCHYVYYIHIHYVHIYICICSKEV